MIVPIFNEVKSLHSGVGTLREIAKIEGFEGTCLVVATKLRKQKKDTFTKSDWDQSIDFQNVADAVKAAGFDHLVLPLKFSAVFDTIFEKEMSIGALCDADPLAAYSFRDVRTQFDAIYKQIDEVSHAK